ncbi:hypothetical protein llap_7868 [Limosa lapponica baueri]|uniref:Uncharacterized protein n=1 Tax=Limosa lapponica baueri TaxID=1758121 RepID=A0A2I0U6X4_LIMLA|nr:hypothetical protein llap_7868 [Limosa lapponica baueri]
MILSRYSTLMRPQLECWVQVQARQYDRYTDIELVQRRARNMIKGLENLPHEERLKELDLASLDKRRLRGDLLTIDPTLSRAAALESLQPQQLGIQRVHSEADLVGDGRFRDISFTLNDLEKEFDFGSSPFQITTDNKKDKIKQSKNLKEKRLVISQNSIDQIKSPFALSCVPAQVQDFILTLIELHKVPVCPFLQLVEVPLDGSMTLMYSGHSSQICVICNLAECTLCTFVQIFTEGVKQNWTYY